MNIRRGTPENPFRILLVEDNPGDADLFVEALEGVSASHQTSVMTDGEAALSFLRGAGGEAASVPDLIFVDLNLPKVDGRELIAELKTDKRLAHIPIVVLTSSEGEGDLERVYRLGANCMMRKPVKLEDFFSSLRLAAEFWLSVVRLPPRIGEAG